MSLKYTISLVTLDRGWPYSLMVVEYRIVGDLFISWSKYLTPIFFYKKPNFTKSFECEPNVEAKLSQHENIYSRDVSIGFVQPKEPLKHGNPSITRTDICYLSRNAQTWVVWIRVHHDISLHMEQLGTSFHIDDTPKKHGKPNVLCLIH